MIVMIAPDMTMPANVPYIVYTIIWSRAWKKVYPVCSMSWYSVSFGRARTHAADAASSVTSAVARAAYIIIGVY